MPCHDRHHSIDQNPGLIDGQGHICTTENRQDRHVELRYVLHRAGLPVPIFSLFRQTAQIAGKLVRDPFTRYLSALRQVNESTG